MSLESPVRILIAGGAYAGLAAALHSLDLFHGQQPRNASRPPFEPVRVPVEICIVDERDGFFHLIGTPLAFASKGYAPRAWVRFEDIPALQHPAIRWVQGTVKSIDTQSRRARVAHAGSHEEHEIPYDYFVAATGIRRAWPAAPTSLTRAQFLEETAQHIDSITKSDHAVVVVGGGAVGVETAAELKYTHPELNVQLIHSRSNLLSSEPLPEDCKRAALEALRDLGVEVTLNSRVQDFADTHNEEGQPDQTLTLQDGRRVAAGCVMKAMVPGEPSTAYLPDGVLDGDGMVKINSLFRFVDEGRDPYHLAAGDLVAWSGIKRCGRAQSMGARVAQNIYQHVLSSQGGGSTDYVEYQQISPVIALAVGNKAVVYDSKGTRCSEEQMEHFFGDDLGLEMCWNSLQLNRSPGSTHGGNGETRL